MKDPVIVDSSLHKAFTILYSIYILTAIVASFALPPSLEAVGGADLTKFWIVGLGVASVFSFVFSRNRKHERREMLSTCILVGALVVYSAAFLYYGVTQMDLDRITLAVFTSSFAVLPGWRVLFFYKKYRKPRGEQTNG